MEARLHGLAFAVAVCCLLACGSLIRSTSPATLVDFLAARVQVRPPPPRCGGVALGPRPVASCGAVAEGSRALIGLCGALVICVRGARLALRSQGQGGRFNVGQYYMPKLKGAKKMAVLRKRKNYGTHGARKVPRRYPLYDKLEELDEKLPWYTVISEPEEPLDPVMDVPLLERYPWAGSLEKVPKEKQEKESRPATGMEPYFGSFTKQNLPPLGRRQLYVFRRGWPRYNYPPWINRPLIGEGIKVIHNLPFKKDRRPRENQLTRAQLNSLKRQQEQNDKAMDEVMGELGDGLDAELDGLKE